VTSPQAIRLDVRFANAYHDRGFAYTALGEYDRAVGDYEADIDCGRGCLAYYNAASSTPPRRFRGGFRGLQPGHPAQSDCFSAWYKRGDLCGHGASMTRHADYSEASACLRTLSPLITVAPAPTTTRGVRPRRRRVH